MSVICCQADILDKFFVEYLQQFNLPILTTTELVEYSKTHKITEIICVQSTDCLPSFSSTPKISVINTEQLSDSGRKKFFLDMLNRIERSLGYRIDIYDYSYVNAVILQRAIIYRPYILNPTENELLKTLLTGPKRYDIAFVGAFSPRRIKVLDSIRRLGFNIWQSESTYGRTRDIEIASCKLLLNIHWSESYQIFESIRCNRWLFAGLPVITEQSLDKPEHPLLTIASYEDLVETVQRVLKA